MGNEAAGPKIGAGHAAGMLRQGIRELRGALYPESNVAQPLDLGIYGSATPQEVYDARQQQPPDPPGRDPAWVAAPPGYESVLSEILRQAEARQPPQADRGGPERG